MHQSPQHVLRSAECRDISRGAWWAPALLAPLKQLVLTMLPGPEHYYTKKNITRSGADKGQRVLIMM